MPEPGDPSTIDCTQRLLPLLEELRAGDVPENGEWLARVADVIRPRRRERPEVAAPRLRALTQLLVDQPDFAAAFNAHLGRLLCTRMHRILYADPGSLTHEGFMGGLLRRSLGNLLPPATDNYFLRDVVAEVFDASSDHVWLEAIPRDDWNNLLCAIGVDDPSFAQARRQCRHELLEALRLAAVRLAALGSDAALLQYQPALARHESPFLAQAGEVHDLILRHGDAPDAVVDERHLDVLLDQCDGYIESIRRRSREAGVGVSLVVLLARMEQLIARMRILRDLVTPRADAPPDSPDARRARSLDFFLLLVRQENRRNSVRDQLSGITELLARRVTEQASRSGEHYITASRSEFVAMYRAAAGAGFIIAVLALVKLVIAKLHLPLLWEGVAFSLNYGLGFVLIHVLHMTIATKQPAMTAATLAASLDGRDDRDTRLDALAELAAEVSRTQWLSIAGNVTVTLLTAFAIAMTAVQFVGWNPADAAKSAHLLHDLHPWKSLALFHAAIAGVYLFLSGLISGYYDNLSLYHHIPQRLRRVKWLRSAPRRGAAGQALDLRRAQPRRTGGQLPVRLHARLHADRGPAGRTAARHSSRRLRIGEPGLWARRRAVRGAGRNHTGERGRRVAGRAREPARQFRAGAQGGAALARHYARADRGPVGPRAAAVPAATAGLLLAAGERAGRRRQLRWRACTRSVT